MKNLGLAMAILLMTSSVSPRADDWPAPRVQHVFSSNGRFFVRIVPGTSINRPGGATSAPRQGKSRGEFYARHPDRSYRLVADVELRNQFGPTYAIVTDDGYLVTFDEWFQMGMGEVMAFYRPTGALIRAVRIEELYTPDKLATLPRSVSSRQWRCGIFYTPPTRTNDETLTVFEHFGGTFEVLARTGTFEYRGGTAPCPPGNTTMFR
jgi:hypothetical protein